MPLAQFRKWQPDMHPDRIISQRWRRHLLFSLTCAEPSQNKRGNRRKMLMRSVLLLAFVSLSGQSQTIKENTPLP
jgi:hypothetical protein